MCSQLISDDVHQFPPVDHCFIYSVQYSSFFCSPVLVMFWTVSNRQSTIYLSVNWTSSHHQQSVPGPVTQPSDAQSVSFDYRQSNHQDFLYFSKTRICTRAQDCFKSISAAAVAVFLPPATFAFYLNFLATSFWNIFFLHISLSLLLRITYPPG